MPMVPRQNRHNQELFWGCPSYPNCNGTKPGNKTKTIEKEWERYRKIKAESQDAKIDDSLKGSIDELNRRIAELVEAGKLTLPQVAIEGAQDIDGKLNALADGKEAKRMATKKNPGLKDGAMSTVGVVKDAFLTAGKQEVAAAAAEGCIALARKYSGDYWPAFFDTPGGKRIAQLFAPVMIHMMCESFGESLPLAEYGKTVAQLAIEGTSKETVHEARAVVQPFIRDLVALGVSLKVPELQAPGVQALLSAAAQGGTAVETEKSPEKVRAR
jgi:ssDNA-binding Zn-finger/Zn-ribbon topoisomerase 1